MSTITLLVGIGWVCLLLGMILLGGGEMLFGHAPDGGREQFYAQQATDFRRTARDSEKLADAFYNKSTGRDKSDEPKDNSEWLAWYHDAKNKSESYAKLSTLDRAKADEVDGIRKELKLQRLERLRVAHVSAAVLLFAGIPLVSISLFRQK